MRLNIPCGVRMRKVCTHLEHICVKNILQCSFMHDLLFTTLITLGMSADFSDQDVLTYLLELYSLKQISKKFFINIALELCRSD